MKTIYNYLENIFEHNNNLIVFELGAHIGNDTKKLLKIFNNPIFYCFECDPRNIKKLKQINSINIVKKAVSNNNTVATFYQSNGTPKHHSRNNTASSSLHKPTGHLKQWSWVNFDKRIQVEVCTLDSFCKNNNINKIDFIWADIQGAEYNMILGAQDILKKTKYLYTEYSNKELYAGQKSLNQLKAALPGKWAIVNDFISDVLFVNEDYKD